MSSKKTIFDCYQKARNIKTKPINNRPTEVDLLIGDRSKSKKLGWKPQYDLAGLVKEMVASDLAILKR
jgi:GDPmannose 4,6-dehydratase